ncbi:MAG: hypothetical protein U1E15_13130 [Hyphomicrobiales bacterium]
MTAYIVAPENSYIGTGSRFFLTAGTASSFVLETGAFLGSTDNDNARFHETNWLELVMLVNFAPHRIVQRAVAAGEWCRLKSDHWR